jgi:two-component system, chemotaxis family, protein-glutamate methylesterase/glutaminase
MAGRDIIVVGGSAGAIEALTAIISGLPDRFPAKVFVVVHTSPTGSSKLADILARTSPLPVAIAQDGAPLKPGHIYIARPDYHLLVGQGEMGVTHGPKENGFRPAIDPLFYSAARTYGRRVIGVLLSGALDDGTYGLQIIKEHGGIVVVQHPDDALVANMPLSAIQNVEVDHILKAINIPSLLVQLTDHSVATPEGHASAHQEKAVTSPTLHVAGAHSGKLDGPPTVLTCPECGGTLWESEEGKMLRFRCHTGHSFGAETLLGQQDGKLEAALWNAVRVLQERAILRRQLADRMGQQGAKQVAAEYAKAAKAAEQDAATIRNLLVQNTEPLSGKPKRHRARKSPKPARGSRRSTA